MMRIHEYPTLCVLFSVTLYFFCLGNAAAMPGFAPVLATVDADKEVFYLLDAHEITFNQKVFRKYRIWRRNNQTDQITLVSWLGTRWLPLPQNIVGMSWDGTYQRLLFVDAHSSKIFALNPNTNKKTLISGAKRGAGAPFGNLGALVVDPIEQRIILIDQSRNDDATDRILTQVALDTGDRTPFFTAPVTDDKRELFLAFDPNIYQVFLSYGAGVWAINPYTRAHRILSDSQLNIGQGPVMIRGNQIAFDYDRHRLLITEPLLKRIIGIDVATGERSLVVSTKDNDQKTLCWPRAISIFGETSLIADEGHKAWIKLNLTDHQWSSFPEGTNQNRSSCKRVNNAMVANLLINALEDRPKSRPITAIASTENNGNLTASVSAQTLEVIKNLILLVALLFAGSIYYLFILSTLPIQLFIYVLLGPNALADTYRATASFVGMFLEMLLAFLESLFTPAV